jgi:DNA-binding response OmpR family regulator
MARIVLFEDEDALRALLAEELEDAGHEVIAVGDGLVSRDAELMRAAEVLVTDLMMPGCDGLEVIANARRANPGLRIVAMSGGGRTVTTDFLPMAQELGARVVLRKPFLPEALLAAVASLAPGAADASAA